LRPWLAAAAVLLLAVVPAAAAIWRVVRLPPRPAPHHVRPKPDRSVAPPIEPAPEETSGIAPEENLEVAPLPSHRPKRARGQFRRSPAVQPVSDPSAADLLDLASRQRASRAWAAAAATYGRLLAAHPDTGAAYVAHVARATIALEHLGRPKRAAHGFTAALRARPDGPLHAEARWGLARAWRAQGEQEAERKALEALLRDYPASAYAELARARLETLEAR
jgi:tetratricopeptide (TPR) repeat protein